MYLIQFLKWRSYKLAVEDLSVEIVEIDLEEIDLEEVDLEEIDLEEVNLEDQKGEKDSIYNIKFDIVIKYKQQNK